MLRLTPGQSSNHAASLVDRGEKQAHSNVDRRLSGAKIGHMNPADTTVIEGDFVVEKNTQFALVASRFNALIVDRLVEGAYDALLRHGVSEKAITLVRVPGSFEIPLVCQRLALSKRFAAVIALGTVIRGSTSHYDHVASEVSKGCGQVALSTHTPVIFGVLTTDSIEQALERSGTKMGNKGWDAALNALEMASLAQKLSASEL